MKEKTIVSHNSNVINFQPTMSISNKWANIIIFVIISYVVSEIFILNIIGYAVNMQQIALSVTVIVSLTL